MSTTTIYTSLDRSEISIIQHLLEQEGISSQVLDETINASAGIAGLGSQGMRLQVPGGQQEKARKILAEHGFLGEFKKFETTGRKKPKMSKGILIFLAALVLVIVAFLLVWFMNAN